MNRKVILMLILVCSSYSYCQQHSIGLKVGINKVNFQSENNFINYDYHKRINGGIVYQYSFKNNF